MVRKLFKYEFQYYSRILLPVYAGILGLALICRIFLLADTYLFDEFFSYVLGVLCVYALYYLSMAITVLTTVFIVIRYFKNLYFGEGYLSLTLPVGAGAHVWVKLATAVLWQIFGFLSILLAGVILASGDLLVELVKAIAYLLRNEFTDLGNHTVFYFVEVLLLMLMGLVSSILFIYFCISLGQLANKGKVGIAIAIYFGSGIVAGILSIIAVVIASLFVNADTFNRLYKLFMDNQYVYTHIIFAAGILILLFASVICFVVSRYILKNKVNLE